MAIIVSYHMLCLGCMHKISRYIIISIPIHLLFKNHLIYSISYMTLVSIVRIIYYNLYTVNRCGVLADYNNIYTSGH